MLDSGRAGAAWVIAVAAKSLGGTIKSAQSKGVPILVNGRPEEYGYDGSVDLVKRRLRQLRPRVVRPAQRTGYRPGQVLQLDWAEMPTRPVVAGRERRV